MSSSVRLPWAEASEELAGVLLLFRERAFMSGSRRVFWAYWGEGWGMGAVRRMVRISSMTYGYQVSQKAELLFDFGMYWD